MDGSDMSPAPSSTVTENRGQKRKRLKRELAQLQELLVRACARQRTLLAAEPTSSHDSRNNIGSDAAVSAVHGDSRGVQEPVGESRGYRAGSVSRQSSGVAAGARGNEVEHESVGQAGADVFTKERRVVGARMTVAGNDFDGSKESSHDQADMQVIKRKKGVAQPKDSIAGEGDLAYEGPEVGWDHSGERSSDGKRKFPGGIPRSGPSPKRLKPLEDIDPAVWQQCIDIVSELSQDSAAWGFMQPVSVLWPGLVDYYQLIKEPMDLGTVLSRLESREYVHPRECARDVRLTFSNAMKYNEKPSDFFQAAKRLKARFDSRFRAVERRLAHPPARAPAPVPSAPPPPVPSFRVEGLANRQAADRGAVKVLSGSEAGLVQAQGNEDRDHHKPSHKPRRKVPPTSNLDEESERKPARPLKPKKSAGTVVRDPESGVLVDPRLGRSKSAKAYGGPRPLTQKEMHRLANTVQDLPEDRQNIIYAMVSKKVQAQPDQQQGIAEFDMGSLDTGTMFEIFRITMNWQKSKSKILRTPKVPKEEGAGKIKAPRPQPRPQPLPAAVEVEEEDVDIMNDSPGREDAVRAEAVQPENAAEAEAAAAAPDDGSDSDSSDSSGSGSSSSSSGSSSESDSDSDSDREKGSE